MHHGNLHFVRGGRFHALTRTALSRGVRRAKCDRAARRSQLGGPDVAASLRPVGGCPARSVEHHGDHSRRRRGGRREEAGAAVRVRPRPGAHPPLLPSCARAHILAGRFCCLLIRATPRTSGPT